MSSVAKTPNGRDSIGKARGQVLVLFALTLGLVLIPALGLGIDASRAFEERRAAQIGVDQAAIAATLAACASAGDPIVKGRAAAAANGFANSGLGSESGDVVTIEQVDGEDADSSPDPYRYRARIQARIPGTFSRVMGAIFNQFDVQVEATANGSNCSPVGAGGPAPGPIYAGGNTCPGGSLRNIEISGNLHDVDGVLQTNGSFYIGGSNSDFDAPPDPAVKYVTTFQDGGSGNTFDLPQQQVAAPTPAWPTGWAPTDMTTAMWTAWAAAPRQNADATQKVTAINSNGLYYTTHIDGMDIGTIHPSVTSMTLVSRNGPVKLPTDLSTADLIGRTFTAYNHPSHPKQNAIIISGFTSTQPCDQFAIEKSGNRGLFKGIFWAPNAMVRWSGNEASLQGAVISWAFQMNGNEHNITGDPSLFTTSTAPQVTMVK